MYRIKKITYATGKRKYIPQKKVFFIWARLSKPCNKEEDAEWFIEEQKGKKVLTITHREY